MKKILIPTDFSPPAENAAKYAIALAAVSKAGVLICNAVSVPSEAPMASRVAWPLMDYATLKEQSDGELDLLVRSLEGSQGDGNRDKFVPDLNFESHRGTVLEVTSLLVKKHKIDLVVMGMAGAGALTQLILGSNCRSMIEKSTFPVLYIPFEVSFKPIKTIAFATDLSPEDILAIKAVLKLMPDAIRIRLIHVTEKEIVPNSKHQVQIDEFLSEIKKRINGVDVAYEYVWNIDTDNGLEWIAEQPDIDMVAMVHKHHSFMSGFFKGSHVQRLSRNTHIPLLVLPSGNKGTS
jgi:nucleotide-binding universal stress UspA family protein